MSNQNFVLTYIIVHLFNLFSSAQTFTPTHRLVIEDQTICSTDNGIWCPRGIVYLDSLMKSPLGGNLEIISVHSSVTGPEPMADIVYWNGCFNNPDVQAASWPGILIDRKEFNNVNANYFALCSQYADDFGVADIAVSLSYDSASRALGVTASAHFAVNAFAPDENYNLALVLTEDSVHGIDSSYVQRNVYSGGVRGPMMGAGIDFAAQPDPVPASLMYYRHVARGIFPNFYGESASLPDTITADETYTYTFPTYTVPANYNAAKMRAIVLLIETVTGEIRNANGANLVPPPTAAASIEEENSVVSIFPNPAHNFLWCKTKTTLPEGQVKIYTLIGALQINSTLGCGRNGVDISGLTPGIYIAEVAASNAVSRELFFKK